MATDRKEHNRKQYLKNREKRLAAQKDYYQANKEARNLYNRQYAQDNKESIAERRTKLYEETKELKREYNRSYYSANAERLKKESKVYRETNKEKCSAMAKNYRRNRKTVDPVYALTLKIRSNINVKIWSNGYTKKSRTHEILGCSYSDFKSHIENKFSPGMDWSNHGEWHLDHIVPVATAETEDDLIRLNHHTNFQPLWAIENLKKGAKNVIR